jgi:hypothetical protein
MDLTGLQLPGGLIYGLGALMLLVGLTWATHQVHRASHRDDRLTEETAREASNRIYAKRSDKLRRKAGPS